MGKTYNIKKEVIDAWLIEIEVTLKNAQDCGLSYNAFKNAIQTGECTQSTHDKINAFLLKQRVKRDKLIR